MKLSHIKTPSDNALLRIALDAGQKLFGGTATGSSGFIFPKHPKVIRRKLTTTYYDTMQVPFKPSKGVAYDKSDEAISPDDVDEDGLLYVLDAELGILVLSGGVKSAKSSFTSEEIKLLQRLGFKQVPALGGMEEWYKGTYRPGYGLAKGELCIIIDEGDELIRLETPNERLDYASKTELFKDLSNRDK